jgi:uncharacterized membrane protein (DUF485 family)
MYIDFTSLNFFAGCVIGAGGMFAAAYILVTIYVLTAPKELNEEAGRILRLINTRNWRKYEDNRLNNIQ